MGSNWSDLNLCCYSFDFHLCYTVVAVDLFVVVAVVVLAAVAVVVPVVAVSKKSVWKHPNWANLVWPKNSKLSV